MLTAPYVNLQLTSAAAEPKLAAQKILFVGQKLAAGTAVSKALTIDIQKGEEDTLFGVNSILSMMVKRARSFNEVNRFDAIALTDNVAGAAATGTIALSGTAAATADYIVQIGNEDFQYSVTIPTTTTATAAATLIAAAITAGTYPFSATDSLGTVTVTFDHKGTAGNEIKINLVQGVAGLTSVITDFASGAGAVDVANIFDNLSERYQAIVYSQDLNQSTLTDFTESRFNTDNVVLDGVGFIAKTDTYANLKTAINLLNLKTLVILANPNEMRYFEFGTNMVAEFAAKRALRLSDGAGIAELVIDYREAIGGRSLASLPYFNTPFGLPLPTGRLTQVQIEDMVAAGGALILVNEANQVVTGEIPTTYKTNAGGTNDAGFKYLNYVDTASVVREFLFRSIKDKYAQTRATSGDLVVGKSMSNTASVKAFLIEKYQELAEDALTVYGDAATKFFKDNLTVTLDAATGVYTFFALTPLVVQARGFNGVVAIQFEI
jgi:phage tail sheath gpL-like